MTNDAIKKMAQDKFPCLNTEQGDTLCINCASVEAVLFGASAHAKLLSEKIEQLERQLAKAVKQRNKFIKKYWSQKDDMTLNEENIVIEGDCRTYDLELSEMDGK